VTATYASDLRFAASAGSTVQTVKPPANKYRTVAPCRAVDTRNATGPWGGPALSGDAARTTIDSVSETPSIPTIVPIPNAAK